MNCKKTIIMNRPALKGRVQPRIPMKRFPFLALAYSLFFAGCDLLPSPAEPPAAGANTLVIYINGAARTALPGDVKASSKYTITVTREGSPLVSPENVTGQGPFLLQLTDTPAVGDVVKVEGLDSDNNSNSQGSCTLTQSHIDGSPVSITLDWGDPEQLGDVALSVSSPSFSGDDEITAVEVSLYQSLADYQSGNGRGFTRYRKADSGKYGAGEDLDLDGLNNIIPIKFDDLPAGNYVVKIEFFRKYVRVSRLVQTIIVRGGLTTNTWDSGGSVLDWKADNFASSNANLNGISIGGEPVSGFSSMTYTYNVYASGAPQDKSLTVTPGASGQDITASLNGTPVSLTSGANLTSMQGTNSLVITVVAPDGVAKQTYAVNYTHIYTTEWFVSNEGSDNNNGTLDYPLATVSNALDKIATTYNGGSNWPGGTANPVAARINISGAITENVDTTGKTLPPILLVGSGSGAEINASTTGGRPLTIGAGTSVILGDGLTLTGGAPTGGAPDGNGGGVYVYGDFTMNGGTISGNSVPQSGGEGGGVYVNGAFTMNGGTISENEVTGHGCSGGGVYVGGGGAIFTMNGGTISGNTADGYDSKGGGVYVNGAFTMNGGIISENSAKDTTGSGASDGGGVAVYGGAFTMNGGAISGNTAKYGGGVRVDDSNLFTMSGGTISGNNADDDGGGVRLSGSNSAFTMEGGTISGNTVTSYGGGGVAVSGGAFTMEGGTISGNSASNNGGGGVRVDSSRFTMSGGTISGNNAGNDGGGVRVDGGGATFTMNGGTISGNSTSTSGGGVHVDGGFATFTMKGGTISGNSASNNGGGVILNSATFTMDVGTISGNSALGSGGGVYLYNSATFTMDVGTISGNSALGSGGGVRLDGNTTFTMSDGTISGNTAKSSDGGGVYLYGNSSGGIATFTMHGGTISGNSVNSARKGGGVYLVDSADSFSMSGSAVIHAGNPVSLGSGAVITLSGALSANPAANIESPTSAGSMALADDPNTSDNDITLDDNYKKFWLNGVSNENGDKIGVDGKVK